jgi:HEAT repeat protein
VLPPVEPPSAGFLVQLFVVPALIVAAVIGVYLLFGRLASSEVDWRELVVDLRNSNPHTRWRGAYGLAQLLEADALRTRTSIPGTAATEATAERTAGSSAPLPLARDPELATELAAALAEELPRKDASDDHRRLLEYLVKSLGWMDVPEVVVPALRPAYEDVQRPWLRQQALIAVGMVAGRAHEQGAPLDDPDLTQELITLTHEETGLLRHLATYYLGFLPDEAAQSRLRLLLNDPDAKTRANAAVGVARSGSLESLAIFEGILIEAAGQSFDPQLVRDDAAAYAYFERVQLVTNALTFISQSAGQFSAEQRDQMRRAAQPLTEAPDAKVRHLAIEALYHLEAAGR